MSFSGLNLLNREFGSIAGLPFFLETLVFTSLGSFIMLYSVSEVW